MLRSVLVGIIVGMLVIVVGVDAAGPRPPEGQVLGTGLYAYGSDLDLDALFGEQAVARDRTARQALLHRVQSLMHEPVRRAPLLERAALHGVGSRLEEPGIGLIPLAPFAAPYEEMRLKQPWGWQAEYR